jgi:hypothetical protein
MRRMDFFYAPFITEELVMKYLCFILLVMSAAVFSSCEGLLGDAVIVYDNRSSVVVIPLEDNATDLYPGQAKAYSYNFMDNIDSGKKVFGFGYFQDGKEFQYPTPGSWDGPLIRRGETKTVEIYDGYFKIR